jgi:hypothetical protein
MAKIKAALAQLAESLGINRRLLARAQHRYKANRKRAFIAHTQQVKAQERADDFLRYDAKTNTRKGEVFIKAGYRHAHVAYENHLRAQFWLGRVKVLQQRINGLQTRQESLEAEAKKARRVKLVGNRASGGSKVGRLKAVAFTSAAACSSGKRPNFYSQAGSWDVDHCITGEHYGERSDCSSWFTSVYKSAGLPDPNGENYSGGYTGTLVANGKQISKPEPGCAVIYGPGTGHHVEMYTGPGNRTIGHGSAPVDPGVIDLFGDGDYRFFKYV